MQLAPRRLLLLMTVAIALAHGAVDPLPVGHPDFFPSPERPLGWRGDGTGSWPGATPVIAWDAASGRNVVWKVETSEAGLCQPIIAGEKIFITADPNLLQCYNVHDGSLLWQTAIDHTEAMSPAERTAARTEQAFWDEEWRLYAEWRCDLQLLLQLVPAAGSLMPATGFQNSSARLPRPDDKEHARLIAAIGANAEAKRLFERLLKDQDAHGWCQQRSGGNSQMLLLQEKRWPLEQRYQEAQKRWQVWFKGYNNWQGYTTFSFATPITDGHHVYVTTANNAVAAVDYAGKVTWLVWEKDIPTTGVMHTRFVASPALCDGKLVVNQNGMLRVYDAASGRKLWEVLGSADVANGKKADKQYPRADPESSSPIAFSLPVAGVGSLGVVFNGEGGLWRLDDGHLLATDIQSAHRGTAVFDPKTRILLTRDQATRLSATNRDTVVAEKVFANEWCFFNNYATMVVVDGRVIGQMCTQSKSDPSKRMKHPVFSLPEGELSWPFNGQLGNNGYVSGIVAGRHHFAFQWSGDRGDLANSLGHSEGPYWVAVGSLDDGNVHRIENGMIDLRMQGNDTWARLHKAVNWGYQQNASPSAQANRIFYRSRGILWCFGDPKQKFPVPKDCPSHAKVP